MRAIGKLACAVLVGVAGLGAGSAQQQSAIKARSHELPQSAAAEVSESRSFTDDDRLSLIAAALDSKIRGAEPDCSHLVHTIYNRAGFSYAYVPSSDLYAGVDQFQRTKKPEPGDLVVWRGHVGIVIKPSQHLFFSVLSTGPGIDDYTTSYWKHRGKPRFFRYLKSASRRPQPSPQLVRTNRVRRATAESGADNDQ